MPSIPHPSQSQLTRTLYLFIALALIFTPIVSTIATGHDVESYRFSVFFSDDTDNPSTGGENILDFGSDEYANADSDARSAGRRGDFYYGTTDPNVTIPYNGSDASFHDWRADRVYKFDERFDENHSIAPAYECIPQSGFDPNGENPEPQQACTETVTPENHDWLHMKDAHTTILDIKEGVEPTFRRLQEKGNDEKARHKQLKYIPSDGEIYVQSDLRLADDVLTKLECDNANWEYIDHEHEETYPVYNNTTGEIEEKTVTYTEQHPTDADQTCTAREYSNYSAAHTAELWNGSSDQYEPIGSVKDDNLGGAVIEYEDVSREEIQPLRIRTKFELNVSITTQEKDWDPDTGWSITDESVNNITHDREIKSRSQPVLITTSQDLTIRQRVIDLSETSQTYIVVDIDGPTDKLTDRRLWSRMYLGDERNQYIGNTWGVYSARQYKHTVRKQADEDTIDHFPNQIVTMRLGTRYPSPFVRVEDSRKAYNRAALVRWDTTSATEYAPQYKPNVNLTSFPVILQDRIVIRDAPGEITKVTDIHGDQITDIETKKVPGRMPEIELTDLSDNRVLVTITDPVSGSPVDNQRVELTGAEREFTQTNSTGEVVINRETSYLKVRSELDNFQQPPNEDCGCYYVSAFNERSYYTSPQLFSMIFELTKMSLMALPFLGLYMWLRLMDNADPDDNDR